MVVGRCCLDVLPRLTEMVRDGAVERGGEAGAPTLRLSETFQSCGEQERPDVTVATLQRCDDVNDLYVNEDVNIP